MGNKQYLYQLIEGKDSPAGRAFDWIMMGLITYSIATMAIETLPGLSSTTLIFLQISEAVITLIFTGEFGLRFYIAERKREYLFSFSGIVDFLAILPFYLTLILGLGGVDLRSLRAFRLFRILYLLKLDRYNKAITRFSRAYYIVREEMVLYLFLALILLYLSAIGIYYFENAAQPEIFSSVFESLWWSVATLTTVGYGDIYPITLGGRLFTFIVLMVGLGIVAVPTGLVASALSQVRKEEETDSTGPTENTAQIRSDSTTG